MTMVTTDDVETEVEFTSSTVFFPRIGRNGAGW